MNSRERRRESSQPPRAEQAEQHPRLVRDSHGEQDERARRDERALGRDRAERELLDAHAPEARPRAQREQVLNEPRVAVADPDERACGDGMCVNAWARGRVGAWARAVAVARVRAWSRYRARWRGIWTSSGSSARPPPARGAHVRDHSFGA